MLTETAADETFISRRKFIRLSGATMVALAFPFNLNNFDYMKTNIYFDVIIIGGSYSGLAAGMALGRSLKKVLMIDSGKPCNRQTPHSHNFITNDGKTPLEISTLARQQVSAYPTIEFYVGEAISGKKINEGFEIETKDGNIFTAKKLIFATGIKDVMLDIAGIDACWGISVLHCPYCHGYEVRNKKTGILGNGVYGYEFSVLISNWTKDLTLFTHGKSTLTQEQTIQLNRHGINIVETKIDRFHHTNGYIEKIIFTDHTECQLEVLYTKTSFEQNSKIPQSLGVDLTEEGYIKTDFTQKTSVDGIYACGDNTTKLRTVANAVSMGTTAGMMLNKEMVMEEFL